MSGTTATIATDTTATATSFDVLLPPCWRQLVTDWLREDAPSFDYGGFVVGTVPQVAVLYGKSRGVLAGRPFFDEVFRQVDCRVEWLLEEGAAVEPVCEVARVYGPACKLLLGERTALNILARCSGVASRARRLVQLKKEHGYEGIIAGTRKCTPGFRLVENEEEAEEAIQAGADIIMLDNFTAAEFKLAAKRLHDRHHTAQRAGEGRRFLIEASGGITEDNIAAYFSPDVDIISLGAMTQGVPHVDFSLKIQRKQ
ncbi:hypothetical protein SYNPS1DRAFT_27538 [Syncephalis pseudoplumigaleata]|uniref:Uncharacterized protein n=1 Tax=Syncephalis pseudoplumigaleata TaxID=1712513 RepID=A0A4P9Z2Q6_9FUNG|nr:hypothetical protein SYNPS1DRAFT_27538 [Syncephalis pseudoplumigaleata]|eukprot:RKP26784.1 hypothetical protein SYNPS1DRAFT_27538 [Syncephalis pseudoplumigaleata]